MTFEKKTDLLNVLFIKPQSEHLFVQELHNRLSNSERGYIMVLSNGRF